MEHVSLYRKYRPLTFGDVIGQDHVVKVLEGSISQGKIAHSYLFSGSRGTGKTSLARILASALDVSDKDLYEIDAASNNKVEDIREIRDGVSTMPFDSKYKMYILDEVHMLSKGAFNALLKTLEEPPAHVIFVLATTELEKVPETIISRCQVFAFKKPTEVILKEVVRRIAKREGYILAEDSLELIALLGEGSFRDTIGMLQKVLSSSKDKKISSTEIETITGAPGGTIINQFIESIAEGTIEKALLQASEVTAKNFDPKLFMHLLLIKFRYALMLRYAPETESRIKEHVSDADLIFLKQVVAKKPETITTHTLEILLDTYIKLRYAVIPSLPLELAVIKILDTKKE